MQYRLSQSETDSKRKFVLSLSKGLGLLRLFCVDKACLSLTELSQRMDLPKATVCRFVYTLQRLGYLERDSETRKYRLGPKVLDLGYSFLKNLDLRHLAYPYLRELAQEVSETVNLSILDDTEIIIIERIEKQQIINLKLQVGSKLPAFCTAMGKSFLASLPDEQIDDILRRSEIKKFTINTETDIGQIRKELIAVRSNGFSINDEELALGSRSIAAPVRSESGKTIAALNISVPSGKMTIREVENKFSRKVIETAERVSSILGYQK